jgi:RND family efflux transporter MFP subunit
MEWSRRSVLALPVSGVVASVAAEAGARVAAGQVLAALDAAPFAAAVAAAEAQLARRKVEHDEAARDARQAQELYDRTVLSTVELENAKMKLTRAAAAVQEAQATLARERYRLRVSSLRAPFAARVLSRHVEVGQSVAAELKPPVAFVIAADGEYLVQARVPPDRIAGLALGQALAVGVGGKKYEARLRAITFEAPSGGQDGAYRLEAAFASGAPLHAGQAARLSLP